MPAPTAPQPVSDEFQSEALRMLAGVARLCDRIVDHLAVERTERRVMLETLDAFARALAEPTRPTPVPTPQPQSAERVVGGSVDAGTPPNVALDAFEDFKPNVSVRVKCATENGEAWVEGFEIVDVLPDPDNPAYHLRRKRDGVVLPTAFAAADIRRVRAAWARSP
jgi:hypothetical protein